jgi:hypothetical protein
MFTAYYTEEMWNDNITCCDNWLSIKQIQEPVGPLVEFYYNGSENKFRMQVFLTLKELCKTWVRPVFRKQFHDQVKEVKEEKVKSKAIPVTGRGGL